MPNYCNNSVRATECFARMTQLKTQAIQTALMGDWNSAVTLNRLLLEDNPEDIDTHNRLAFAFASLGNVKEAKQIYQKVLTLDMQNPIAIRNLKRLTNSQSKYIPNNAVNPQMNNIFIEEPGKTKVIELLNVAEQKVISALRCGETLTLLVKRMKIFVLDNNKQYVGMFPDDISKRLIKFLNGGNKYEAYVKTVDNHRLIIFVKETKRSLRFKNQPSFASFEKSKFMLKNSQEIRVLMREQDEDKEGTDDQEESF